MASKRQAAYMAEVNALMQDAEFVLRGYSDQVKALLMTASDNMTAALHRLPASTWKNRDFGRVRDELDKVLLNFNMEYAQLLGPSLDQSAQAGVRNVLLPFTNNVRFATAQTASYFNPVFMDPFTSAVFDLSLTQIVSVTEEAAAEIYELVKLAMIQQTGAPDAIVKISKIMRGTLEGQAGGIRNVNSAAWRIFRTETMKINNFALHLQSLQVAQIIPGAEKTWHHGMMFGAGQTPRPGHVMLDGTSVAMGDAFENPETKALLLYPGDPDADAGEVIHCGCTHSLKMPSEIDLASNPYFNTEDSFAENDLLAANC